MIPRSIFASPLLILILSTGAPLLIGDDTAAQSSAAMQMDAATFVGEEMCAGCHNDVAEQFGYSMHARLQEWEVRSEYSRCESCHGPGSKHVEESGDPQFIFNFKGKDGREASKACMSCHYSGHSAEWPGSVHFMAGLGCGDCHTIHQSRQVALPSTSPLIGTASPNPDMGMIAPTKQAPPKRASLAKPEPEICFDCHQEKRAQVNYSSHHPIIERRMECSSCHAVHGSDEASLIRAPEGLNDLCTSCHPAKMGPFVFEHAAVEEGCNTCHNPHGTVANNLLVQNEPFLCLQCHEAHFHIGRDGISTPIDRETGYSSNQYGSSGWRQAFTTKCTNCHPTVHGSDLPSQSVTGRGGSLTR